MNFRPALLATTALAAALWIWLALCRWGAGGDGSQLDIAQIVQRGDGLEAPLEAHRRRHEAKRALAAEVVAGRMTLREAAGHFRRLDEAELGHPPGVSRPRGDESAFREGVLDYAWMALGHQGRFASLARWYGETFTTHPELLAGPAGGHLYDAARAAALAAAGQGRDAAGLDYEGRAGFRRQALNWLRAELEAHRRLLGEEPQTARLSVARDMGYWLEDPHLAGVREPDALARLPTAERQAWQKLWANVAATRARASGRTPPEQGDGSEIPAPER
jgi:hypothetical protein